MSLSESERVCFSGDLLRESGNGAQLSVISARISVM